MRHTRYQSLQLRLPREPRTKVNTRRGVNLDRMHESINGLAEDSKRQEAYVRGFEVVVNMIASLTEVGEGLRITARGFYLECYNGGEGIETVNQVITG